MHGFLKQRGTLRVRAVRSKVCTEGSKTSVGQRPGNGQAPTFLFHRELGRGQLFLLDGAGFLRGRGLHYRTGEPVSMSLPAPARGGARLLSPPRLQGAWGAGLGRLTFTLCLKLRAMLRGVRVIHREGSGPGWGRGCGIAH